MVALQGMLQFVQAEIAAAQAAGGGIKARRRVKSTPLWLPAQPAPVPPPDDDDALFLLGLLG